MTRVSSRIPVRDGSGIYRLWFRKKKVNKVQTRPIENDQIRGRNVTCVLREQGLWLFIEVQVLETESTSGMKAKIDVFGEVEGETRELKGGESHRFPLHMRPSRTNFDCWVQILWIPCGDGQLGLLNSSGVQVEAKETVFTAKCDSSIVAEVCEKKESDVVTPQHSGRLEILKNTKNEYWVMVESGLLRANFRIEKFMKLKLTPDHPEVLSVRQFSDHAESEICRILVVDEPVANAFKKAFSDAQSAISQ